MTLDTTLNRRVLVAGALAVLAAPSRAGADTIASLLYEATLATRRANNRGSLSLNKRLGWAAQTMAETMLRTGEFSHSAGGTSLATRVRATGYRYRRISENLAWASRRSASDDQIARVLMDGWMKSPGHRKNILDNQVRDIGIGVAKRGFKTYAVQVFGRPA